MYELQKFNGEKERLTPDQFRKLIPILLKTGKFIILDGEKIINISEIKEVKSEKDPYAGLPECKK
jgi:hypothetical protein